MKWTLYFFFSFVVSCQCRAEDASFAYAISHGAMAKIVCQVVDEVGIPVSNATAHVWFSSYARPQDDADWLVDTDTNGVFSVSHRTNERLAWIVRKPGYYQAFDEILFRDRETECPKVVDGKWQPYGEKRTVVLKRILNPVRLYNPNASCYHKYPELGVWTGFDLQEGDWVSPLGRGQHTDMLVKYTRESRPDGYFKSVDVSFTNNPYAGVYLLTKDVCSEMNSVYAANTNGNYVDTLRYEFERTGKGNRMIRELGAGEYLVFRTRTKVDYNGKLVAAHYGIIMGEWRFIEKGGMSFGPVSFNPTPNDTNLEDAETARRSRLRYRQSMEFENKCKGRGR